MNRTRRIASLALAVAAALALLGAADASAQENYNFTLSLLGGVGGSLDAEPDTGLDDRSLLASFAVVTEPRLHTVARAGRLTLDEEEPFGSLREAELDYLTIGGDYKVLKSFYDSGLFAGIGAYRLEGERGGETVDDTAFGVHIGVSGEVRVTRWLGVVLELAGHWADLDEAQTFATGHAGIAVHF